MDREAPQALSLEHVPTMVSAPFTKGTYTNAVPARAAGLTAPTPAGITLSWWKVWLGKQSRHDGHGKPIAGTWLQDNTDATWSRC